MDPEQTREKYVPLMTRSCSLVSCVVLPVADLYDNVGVVGPSAK